MLLDVATMWARRLDRVIDGDACYEKGLLLTDLPGEKI